MQLFGSPLFTLYFSENSFSWGSKMHAHRVDLRLAYQKPAAPAAQLTFMNMKIHVVVSSYNIYTVNT